MISHEEIFPSEVKLPSFNSNAIEFSIGNIPGLSEHFIYANDDMFFGRPLIINDFFNEDGIPIIPYRKRKWSNPNIEFKIITFHNNKDDFAGFQFKAVTTNTACACESFFRRKMVGEYMHTPVPLTLSLFRRANGSFRKEIKSTIFSRFRSYKNYEMQLLMLLYGINTKLIAPVEITPDIASFVVVKKEGDIYLIPLTIKDPKFFCINVDLDKIRGKIQEWLEHRFPLKSSFEKCDYTLNSTVNNKTNFPNIYW
ncbi:hypothetical protein TRFO_40939 [Tritrichomonas foetus]|uniref:Stealth protein CR2 conserved region 2 domain-containing protein n=1 Tax=Tritrichomonas foetus TaxID=1144522 RepID=A0A1J4IZW4_9EUKA|nr:hypothetical protein TRFO_40939 [Tritrichomonas foetus]|eukprot:OHS92722.1 hypothetical protein TRFO_40939 [Tritrichomonas foetus]